MQNKIISVNSIQEVLTPSSTLANTLYNNIWGDAKNAETNTVPTAKWESMMDFNDLTKIVPTYTLTATWLVTGEVKQAAANVIADLKRDLPFLQDTVFWQPIDSVHCAVFVIDRYEAKKSPTIEQIEHRQEVGYRMLEPIAAKLPVTSIRATGVVVMPDGTICLKGLVDNESLQVLKDEGEKSINDLNDPLIDKLTGQNKMYHMTIGRIARQLTPEQWKLVLDYVQEKYWDKPLGSAPVSELDVAEETGSFLSTRRSYRQIGFQG